MKKPLSIIILMVACMVLLEAQNVQPIPAFKISIANNNVTFDASSSRDPDGSIVSYFWVFGEVNSPNPTFTSSESTTATHSYLTTGTYVATLTVTDNRGGSKAVGSRVRITKINSPPVLVIESTVDSNERQVTINTSGSSDSDGYIQGFVLNFGDNTGNISYDNSSLITHSYTTAGNFQITITAIDNSGAQSSSTLSVFVNKNPIAVISSAIFLEDEGNQEEQESTGEGENRLLQEATDGGEEEEVILDTKTIQVKAAGSSDEDGSIQGYSWDFGDGSAVDNESGEVATHIYTADGFYTITLTVVDNLEGEGTAERTVEVNNCPNLLRGFFQQYYSGNGFNLNPNSPAGAGYDEVIYDGTLSKCDAARSCADQAYYINDAYSFELFSTTDNTEWVCRQYARQNSDPSYFNVPNDLVRLGYGYTNTGEYGEGTNG